MKKNIPLKFAKEFLRLEEFFSMTYKKITLILTISLLLLIAGPSLAERNDESDSLEEEMCEEIDNYDFLYDNDIDYGYSFCLIDNVMDEAFSHLGARYRLGTSGPYSFDCSGFTSYVFKRTGIELSRTSSAQYRQGRPVDKDELQAGDLVFFTSPRSGKSIGHVGIVVDVDMETGKFTFIHASTSFGVMVSDSDESYFVHRYVGARRII